MVSSVSRRPAPVARASASAAASVHSARRGSHRSSKVTMLRLKLVPHPPNCLQVSRTRGNRFDLGAETAHVHGNGSVITGKFVVPHVVEQLIAAEHLTRVPGEEEQQVKFPRCHRDRAALVLNSPCPPADAQVVEAKGIAVL